jgi:hypothetical protein
MAETVPSAEVVEAAAKAIADYVGETRFVYTPHAQVALTAVLPLLRAQIEAEIRLALSDTLDPEEGPVIIAWSVDALADALVARIARGES